MITDAEIRELRSEACAAGDYLMATICEAALAGDATARAECDRQRAGARDLAIVFCERCGELAPWAPSGSLCAACRVLDPLDVEWSANERSALQSEAGSHDCAAITAARLGLSQARTSYGHQIRICSCGHRVKVWNLPR